MKLFPILSLSLSTVITLAAYGGATPESEMKPVTVAVFKNGLAFIMKQGDLPIEGGIGKIAPVPAATLGSLWITPNDPKVILDEVVAYRYKVAEQKNLMALAEVLMANAGKTLTVTYGNEKQYTGEIVGFRELAPSASSGVSAASASLPPAQGVPEFLLLKAEGKLLALYFRNISQVTLPNDPVLQKSSKEERTALRFKLKGAGSHANLTMGYLENGLGWTPSYLVSLRDDKTALLTLQAAVLDDAEDLQDTEVFFVVGVPNFAYAQIPSPLALQQNLLDFIQSANRKDLSGNLGRYSNALLGQNALDVERDQAMAPSPGFETTFEALKGAPEEDLFLYARGGVTLARGERATYNVFSGSVSYQHVYTSAHN